MNNILIILDGILAKHFLERLCTEKGLDYFFTIVYQNDESVDLNVKNVNLEFYKMDPTSTARLEFLMQKDYKQAFIYTQNEFETRKSYEALRSLNENLEINIMDFWGFDLNDKYCNLVDARLNLSKRLFDFLPDVALTAQYIGLGAGEIMEVKIHTGSIFAYRHIASIQQKRWRIVLIYRDSKINFARPSFVLQPNDSILIVGDPAVLQSVFHNIKGSAGQFPLPFGNNVYCVIDMKKMSQSIQNRLIDTSLDLMKKSNAKKIFIKVINPTMNEVYQRLKGLADENEGIFFDFFNTDIKDANSFIENNNIGVFVTDDYYFEKEKKMFFEFKIPILKIGQADFKDIKNSVILSSDESELENQANVIADLSKQLEFDVSLYYYNPNLEENPDIQEYFSALSKLYGKSVNLIRKQDENPLLNLQYREDLLQFVSFDESLINGNISRTLSMSLNRHYRKMKRNYQLFIPVE